MKNETLSVIKNRRSVKHFDPNYKMSAEEIQDLFEAALHSPSSFNIQHWRLVNITAPEKREQLREAAWNQAQVTEASLLLAVCADLNAPDKAPERYWENAPEEVKNYLVPKIGFFYADNPQLRRDEALRSVGIISQTLMIAAKSMGLDSCPMIGFDPVKAAEIIRLPADHVIGMFITVGKAVTPARPKGGFLPAQEVIIENGW